MRPAIHKSLRKSFRVHRSISKLVNAMLGPSGHKSPPSRRTTLQTIAMCESNPAGLVMKLFAPTKLRKKPPLVVVPHGCNQTPESLDAASGFSRYATERGFVLLYPQQTGSNNPNGCFNWFRPSAVARDRGEVLSIRQMIEQACSRYGVDRRRVFIVGLSAGGAMTAALVAHYPALFAGAAIVAGMPFGSVRDAMSALRAMKSGAPVPVAGWGSLVEDLSDQGSSWPPMSIWQGTGDKVVNPRNAEANVAQWLEAAGMDRSLGRVERKAWGELHIWEVAKKRKVSLYLISGMGHALPIKTRSNGASRRFRDPFVRSAGISAPVELMRLWGLTRL
ncbi:polyhydroxybutyrate depolymerase [Rhizobium sp. AC44/96]|nr:MULTISPECIES: PHB depolymerase family esterase [unclassified Rhizobium]MDM9623293.1 PHB depolymerase family esterase [Rhizobium sp. S96]OCJ12850.1 polyhydroxybutyrate depolymerase [Rhizobium sp. AC44/96]